jgi:steroid 5-alpha reductase family enzyme
MSPAPFALLPLGVLIAMAVVMSSGWLFQRAVNNGGWSDVFWTYGTGATCAVACLAPFGGAAAPSWRQVLVAALVAIWSLRLGTYVALRVAKGSEDARYADFRRAWGRDFQRNMFGLLIVQAPVTALLSLSILVAARHPHAGVRIADVVGALILIGSIFGEGVADQQMKAFRANPASKGKVCDTGLWAWSRHPNYLFEALGWIAYPVIALDPAQPLSLVSLIAPVVMFVVLRFGTGVPPLEEAMLKSRGDAYRLYQARVSAFWPRPPKPLIAARALTPRETAPRETAPPRLDPEKSQ